MSELSYGIAACVGDVIGVVLATTIVFWIIPRLKRWYVGRRSVDRKIERLISRAGGKVDGGAVLPGGHGFVTASFPLPEDHWLTTEGHDEPPTPPASFPLGTNDPRRAEWVEHIRAATRYAIRRSTMNGKVKDFDPDAMVQNMVVGMVGYWTPDGRSHL